MPPYRVVSVHDSWRVICTPDGTGRWQYPRDCAVEDRNGLVVFVNPFSYFAFTMRGHIPGDGMLGRDFADGPEGVILTFLGPSDTEAQMAQDPFQRGGAPYFPDLTGYAAAQAAAIALMQ